MYLLRLDDASEYWKKTAWERMYGLLKRYGIVPIIAIIPQNEDIKLHAFGKDICFWETIQKWLGEDWVPALHGYNHVLDSPSGGINPVNFRSEFAGKLLDEQKDKLKKGYAVLNEHGIRPEIFVAPAHTFDLTTLEALQSETPIRIISDTIANDVYFKHGFHFIPQQCGAVRRLPLKLTTFCYHPNTTSDKDFAKLEKFLIKYKTEFIALSKLVLHKRNYSLLDKLLCQAYLLPRSIRQLVRR